MTFPFPAIPPLARICGVPAYANSGGTGNRTASITVTASASLLVNNDPPKMVDGDTTSNAGNSSSGNAVSGLEIRFDFGSGNYRLITEVKYYQNDSQTHGTFQWQGSDDGSSWTSIGSTFALGGAATQTITTMSGATVGYRYHRLLGTSGSMALGSWMREFEFKISSCS